MKPLILSLIISLFTFNAFALEVIVSDVFDGDTFVTKQGEKVRLLSINTPEISHNNYPSEPFAVEAKKYLKAQVKGKKVSLIFSNEKKDRYGRLLAHVYLGDRWINKELVEEGLAHVYSFPDSTIKALVLELIEAENKARKHKKLIWSDTTFKTLNATKKIEDWRIGKFQVVEGVVLKQHKSKNRFYLNFGENWRNDFSVEIPRKYWDKFTDMQKMYMDKKIRIRGVLKPVNGVLITVTHPEQIEVLDSLKN